MVRQLIYILFTALLSMTFASIAAMAASPNNSSKNVDHAARSANNLNWVRYTDNAEGAFSMDIPVGWQVQGGMYRFGYFDVRWMMDVRSLDSKIIMRIFDVNVPPYTLPGSHTGREGQPYSRPQQFQMMVSSYRSGQSYAELYAKHRFSGLCKRMSPRQPDWAPTMPEAWKDDPGTRSTEGSAFYDCDTSDGPRVVSVYTRTTLNPNNGLWFVTPISIITSPGNATLAHNMVQHMIDTWAKNPEWVQYQNQMTQIGLNQIRAGFQQFMHQMQAYHEARTATMNRQVAGYQSHQNTQAQQVSSWGENLTGLQNVSDPMTGAQFQVFSGPKVNYYANGNGVKINSDVSPGADFHQLTPTGP
jgi:hypothetical protein